MATTSAALVARISDAGATDEQRRAAELELCRQLSPRLDLYGRRHLRDEAAAADLVQEALLAVLGSAREGRIDDPAHVERFALGVCRNLVSRHYRAASRSRNLQALASPLAEHQFPPAFSRLDAIRVSMCLSRVSPRDQKVVMMTFRDDHSADEIASELGISAGNVRVIRHRVIAALQKCVEGAAA